jgi:hypothetical protein
MHNMFFSVILSATILLAVPAIASADEVRVFGLHVGSAEITEVRSAAVALGASESDRGISAVTEGPLLKYRGDFGLEGTTASVFLFDKGGKLVAVSLEIDKRQYDRIVDVLKAKYRVVNELRPFVGDRSVRLVAGNIDIRLDAPHMSFEMTLTYGTEAFWQTLLEWQRAKEQARRSQQASQL